jgi:hypothetical protein
VTRFVENLTPYDSTFTTQFYHDTVIQVIDHFCMDTGKPDTTEQFARLALLSCSIYITVTKFCRLAAFTSPQIERTDCCTDC